MGCGDYPVPALFQCSSHSGIRSRACQPWPPSRRKVFRVLMLLRELNHPGAGAEALAADVGGRKPCPPYNVHQCLLQRGLSQLAVLPMWFQLLKLWLLRSFTLRNFIEEENRPTSAHSASYCEALRFATSLRTRQGAGAGEEGEIAKLYASQLH